MKEFTLQELKYLKLVIGQEIKWEYVEFCNGVLLKELHKKLEEMIDEKSNHESC